jgi:hypothetical protein
MYRRLFSFAACAALLFAGAGSAFAQDQKERPKLKGYIAVRPASHSAVEGMKNELMATGSTKKSMLPLFTFSVESNRDGNNYTGVIVGANPFTKGDNRGDNKGDGEGDNSRDVSVKTFVVPVIVTLNSVGTTISPNPPPGGSFTVGPGVTTIDPSVADTPCLGTGGNNNPTTLLLQSPLLNSALFDMGGTIVGNTQYIDAFQRAEFWNALGPEGRQGYHLRLSPVLLPAIRINIPADQGAALGTGLLGACDPLGIIDFGFFDNLIQTSILPILAKQGVDPSTFPILLFKNVVTADMPITNLNNCCFLGYHSSTSTVPFQTYSPLEFDTAGLFGPSAADTAVMSHEVAEWANDPFGDNPTPAWGGTGQVPPGFCQNNFEVGDPLTGTAFPPVVMSNGFTYHLQELAFFSWFYASPSVGIHGWFSDDGTFLSDAGPTCVPAPGNASSLPPGVIPPRVN